MTVGLLLMLPRDLSQIYTINDSKITLFHSSIHSSAHPSVSPLYILSHITLLGETYELGLLRNESYSLIFHFFRISPIPPAVQEPIVGGEKESVFELDIMRTFHMRSFIFVENFQLVNLNLGILPTFPELKIY